MDKTQLEKMVNSGLSMYKISSKTGKSKSTVRYWLCKYELTTTKIYKCKCGETNPKKFSKGRFSECKVCRTKRQTVANKKRKQEFVEYKGGKCFVCGYDKCSAALDFHHLNPEEKDPNWKKMKTWNFLKAKIEIDKCVLLCKNCHSEVHYGDSNPLMFLIL